MTKMIAVVVAILFMAAVVAKVEVVAFGTQVLSLDFGKVHNLPSAE